MNQLSRASRGRTVAMAALVGSVLTLMPAPMAMHAIAANPKATFVDVEADTADVSPGSTVVLTATVYDEDGYPVFVERELDAEQQPDGAEALEGEAATPDQTA